MALHVIAPGARTLVQDAGRPGHAHLGVPRSGAADMTSLTLANRLVGNADDAAALEILISGPTLTFDQDAVIAVTGAPTTLALDGLAVPAGHTLHVLSGQTLTVGIVSTGLRSYLAVAGGIATPEVLGSRSSCTLSGLGGLPLAVGDVVAVGPSTGFTGYRATVRREVGTVCRVLTGPHADLFSARALDAFFSRSWEVSPASSRVGVRFHGTVPDAPEVSLPSLGMVTGAVQVPPNGSPIALGPDHGTTGGYPVIATVISSDLPVLAQARPGTTITFTPVSVEQAQQAAVAQTAALHRAVLDLAAISR